ncbi:hypothetical protein QAD02_023737 [Eretmocerus hayati]|uniref:Uncharacterized protein n=1 Tax=Eretmocerus hayati TaxID=131215 RepID=A0ACC2Q029_9HYME|nr:hypothetical protein QAD02_023737 [Eretmocerus hayati]
MYDSASCSYAGALELKGANGGSSGTGLTNGGLTNGTSSSATACISASSVHVSGASVKQENWPYRGLSCGSTFQQLKQSVEKAKQALADRGGYLAGAFSPPPRANSANLSPTSAISGESCDILISIISTLQIRTEKLRRMNDFISEPIGGFSIMFSEHDGVRISRASVL